MKALYLILSLTIITLFSSCSDKVLTYSLDPITQDTINRTNELGRQGYWIVTADCAKGLPKIPQDSLSEGGTKIVPVEFKPSVKSIGNYVNNKKQGVWTSYYEDGSVSATEEFKYDVASHN